MIRIDISRTSEDWATVATGLEGNEKKNKVTLRNSQPLACGQPYPTGSCVPSLHVCALVRAEERVGWNIAGNGSPLFSTREHHQSTLL